MREPVATIDVEAVRRDSFVARAEYHGALGSTNDRCRQLAEQTPCELPVLVVADLQTAGRGRGGNRWWTGPGSLAFSLLFDPAVRGIERRRFPMISLAAAVAIAETSAARLAGRQVGLHWPNDVFVNGRKLAGVLVEALADGRHILGIGWNVNNSVSQAPTELASVATTLSDLAGAAFDRSELLRDLLARLDLALARLATDADSLGRWADQLCAQRGRRLTIDQGGRLTSGVCAGIAPDGALVLDTPAGRQACYSGVLVYGRGG